MVFNFPLILILIKNSINNLYFVFNILMLLGDIGLPLINDDYTNFLKEKAESFEHIFIVLGNHEFYQSKMEDIMNYF